MSIHADPAGSLPGLAAAAQAGVSGPGGTTGQEDLRTGRERTRTAQGSPGGQAGPGAGPGQVPPGTVISTAGLTLGFGDRDVLRDVAINIHRGRVTALLGPTGSGKTTLLRTFNRMNDSVPGYRHSGDVLFDGLSIWHPRTDTMALRRRVGMLFQRPNPFPMSILDNIVAGVRAHRLAGRGELRPIAEQRLREVGLWDAVSGRLKESPFRLSGGQQQLLCLARALAVGPDVLLLDEPTSSLDPIATEAIEGLIRTLTPRITVIIITHNLAQARRVADRTMFLNKGRIVEHGETHQVFENPAEEETAQYVTGRFG